MTEWGVVSVLIALVGLFITVGAPIIKLVASITKLNSTVQAIQMDLQELTEHNTASHSRIFSRLDGHDEKLQDHEIRISSIERTS